MRKDLIINVIDQEMRVIQCNSSKLYNKSRHYLRLHFKFNQSWNGLSKSVIFLCDDEENYEYPLTDDALIVPNTFLTGNGFKFTLVGRNTSEDILVTTNTLTINLKSSDYTTDISTFDDDISDVYTVLLERFDDYYTKQEIQTILSRLGNTHTHLVEQITDFDDEIVTDFDLFCQDLIDSINSE